MKHSLGSMSELKCESKPYCLLIPGRDRLHSSVQVVSICKLRRVDADRCRLNANRLIKTTPSALYFVSLPTR